MNKLYENIRAFRKANHWSQEELANRMGYTDRSMIAKIETGQVDLAESKIMAFAKVFGVKPTILMGWNDDDSEKIVKALELYKQYENLSPNRQKAFRSLLETLRSDE